MKYKLILEIVESVVDQEKDADTEYRTILEFKSDKLSSVASVMTTYANEHEE